MIFKVRSEEVIFFMVSFGISIVIARSASHALSAGSVRNLKQIASRSLH